MERGGGISILHPLPLWSKKETKNIATRSVPLTRNRNWTKCPVNHRALLIFSPTFSLPDPRFAHCCTTQFDRDTLSFFLRLLVQVLMATFRTAPVQFFIPPSTSTGRENRRKWIENSGSFLAWRAIIYSVFPIVVERFHPLFWKGGGVYRV